MPPKQQTEQGDKDDNNVEEEHDTCKEVVNDFLDAAWKVMTPQMIDHFRCMLIDDLAVPKKDVDKFIQYQRELRRKRICLKNLNRPVKIGPRNQWIKEVSKDIADRLATFVVGVLLSNRSARTKRITEKVLEKLCEVTGEDTDINSAKSRVERTLVVVADQMAAWINETLIELEENMDKIVICKPVSREAIASESESSSESELEKISESSISTVTGAEREEDGSGERVEHKDKKQAESKPVRESEEKEKPKGKTKERQSEFEGEEDLEEKESEDEERESVQETEEEGEDEEEEEDIETGEAEDSPDVESDVEESEEEFEAESESETESESEEGSGEESDEDEESDEEESEEVEGGEEEEEEEEHEVDVEEVVGEPKSFIELEEESSVAGSQEVTPVESREQRLPGDVLDLLKEDIARISFLDEKTDRRIAMKEVIDKRLEKIAKEKLAQSLSSMVKYDIDETAAVVANWVEKILAAAEEMPEVTPIYERQGFAFEISQGQGSQLQVNKVSSTTVAEKVADIRGVDLPIRRKIVPKTMSPMDLRSGKDWADWALGAANIGEEWGKWMDSTLEQVANHLNPDKSEKRGSEDYSAWANWRDERGREAQKWRLERQKIKDEGRLWNRKLEGSRKPKELEAPERISKVHSYSSKSSEKGR